MVNVSFSNETMTRIDRMRAGTSGRPEVKRAAWVAWATEQFIALCAGERAPVRETKRSRVVRVEPTGPETDTRPGGPEGHRLRAARIKADLSHADLAAGISSAKVSRGMVQRAERAATLDGYPALRAWLERQEATAKGDGS